MAQTNDQIHEGNYDLGKKGEMTILRKLHRKLMNQLSASYGYQRFSEMLHCDGTNNGFDCTFEKGTREISQEALLYPRYMIHHTRFARS